MKVGPWDWAVYKYGLSRAVRKFPAGRDVTVARDDINYYSPASFGTAALRKLYQCARLVGRARPCFDGDAAHLRVVLL